MTTDDNDNTGPEVELFDAWVNKNYGGNSRTKTITNEKYSRICKLIRGEDPNSNAKFRFWVRNKGFRLLRHDKLTDEILDDPSGSLFVSLHAKESSTPMGERSIEKFLRTNLPAISFFRKVAIVEEFYGIIKCSHVDEKGVHAGQKKTYRLVSDTYAFLPREVITFYLLNCKTCKPRIQKYGPIPSKIRLNNIGPRKNIPSTKDSPPNHVKPENAEGKEDANTAPHQVIRPSPKRYRPTFVDMPGEERYSKVSSMEYKEIGREEPSLLKILDGRMSHPPRHEYPSPTYSSHSPPKIVDSGTPSGTPHKQEEEKCPKNYYYYPSSYIVANPPPRMEHTEYRIPNTEYELIPERAQEEMDRMMDMRRERIQAFEREVLQVPHPSYSYMHPERTARRYFHGGCRVQPYKLHDKYHGDTPQTFRKLVYETRHDRDIVAAARKHYDSSAYAAYMAGHRRMDMDKTTTDGQRSHEDNWSCVPKPSPELRQHHDKLVVPIHAPNNEMRELYAFDYAKDRSRMIGQRKENDYYSVHQYHRVVCDTVNSSLASLCYISEDERDRVSQSLRIPDPSKICKVLQETNSDKGDVLVVDDEK